MSSEGDRETVVSTPFEIRTVIKNVTLVTSKATRTPHSTHTAFTIFCAARQVQILATAAGSMLQVRPHPPHGRRQLRLDFVAIVEATSLNASRLADLDMNASV